MKRQRRIQIHIVLLAVLAAIASLVQGCAGPLYHPGDYEIVTPGPLAPGMSRVIFVRPKNFGTTVRAKILHVTSEQFRYAGAVGNKEKLAYDVVPGEHLFMVIGVDADFMSATLEEDKTYYAEVISHTTVWRTIVWLFFNFWIDWYGLFDLRAIHKAEIETGIPAEWVAASRWNMPGDSEAEWTKRNRLLIQKRFYRYRPKWSYKFEDGPPRLNPEDGFVGS